MDNFSESGSSAFGDVLRKQLEEKIAFYAGRIKETRTNDEWIEEAVTSYKNSIKHEKKPEDNLKRKKSSDKMGDDEEKKKKKKKKTKDEDIEDSIEKMDNLDLDDDKKKKKKKHKN